jgi:hypothetical protein
MGECDLGDYKLEFRMGREVDFDVELKNIVEYL